ncbi:MAG: amidohydrolase family protein [Sphingobium sp.]
MPLHIVLRAIAIIACSFALSTHAWAKDDDNAAATAEQNTKRRVAELVEKSAPRPFALLEAGATTIYRGATLIDGTGASPRSGMAIVVTGQKIADILPAANIPADMLNRAHVVELDGRYVIPGLIDEHQHIATPPNPVVAQSRLRREIYGGVTAIRIMGDDLRLVSEVSRQALAGEIPGPDVYMAAIFAGPEFFKDPRVAADSLGYESGAAPWMQMIDENTDLALAIARARGAGATAVKTYAYLSADLIRRIAEEAHRQNMMVWSHAALVPAKPSEVLAAGVDSMSHICMIPYEAMNEQALRNKGANGRTKMQVDAVRKGNNAQVARLFREMKRRNVILDATGLTCSNMEQFMVTPENRKAATGLSAKLLRQAHSEGVEIGAGTDSDGTSESQYPAIDDELEFLVEMTGMSPAEALRAATVTAARATGVENIMGTVTPGKLANFVVLKKNPLSDVKNIRTVVMTVKRGVRYNRADFDAADEPCTKQ